MMRLRRIEVLTVVLAVAVVAGALLVKHRWQQAARGTPITRMAASAYDAGPRIVFRNTAVGKDYGLVATVPLSDPSARRAISDVACDRVYATARDASCLRTERGVTTSYEWLELGPRLQTRRTLRLAGVPSRTRLSPDGRLEASTSFVGRDSYMQVGFSTATVIRVVGGRSVGNLEDFALIVHGKRLAPVDRNVWGVTFARDDTTFYATAVTGGTPSLVRGNLRTRTLTALRSPAECPSLSPDGGRVAYKVDAGHGGEKHWKLAVLDLATGRQRVLNGERASVDDQAEWLDDHTLLYGLPRAGQPGVSDVWSVDIGSADAAPRRFISQAWSPAVVR